MPRIGDGRIIGVTKPLPKPRAAPFLASAFRLQLCPLVVRVAGSKPHTNAMPNIESHIAGSQKLTEIFGCWPSFHDAEVLEFNLWRGDMKPGDWDDSNVMPIITAKVHIFIESPESQHTLATLRFEEVDDVRMEGFNHQNAILGLSISVQEQLRVESGEGLPPYLVVQFKPAFGISASFRCLRIEVVDAVRCTEDGKVQS